VPASLAARPAALVLAALLAPVPARAAEAPIPPPPRARVTDTVSLLSPAVRQSLERRLEDHERRTGHQVLVWIGETTGDTPVEEFAVEAFERWKVGRAGRDDGLVLFVFTADRKAKIEVGYGLEDRVTDLLASRVIREVLAPRLQAGDADGAVTGAVGALLAAIDAGGGGPGPPSSAAPLPSRGAPTLGPAQKVLLGLAVLAFLVLLITNPSLAIWLLVSIASGGRSGGGGSGAGSGGWRGGGGRSGGGGATGSW